MTRHVPLFGLTATHRYGATYEVTFGQVTYTATDYSGATCGLWHAAIHSASTLECWALGTGETLTEAEAACERMLRREATKRRETCDEIDARRREAA